MTKRWYGSGACFVTSRALSAISCCCQPHATARSWASRGHWRSDEHSLAPGELENIGIELEHSRKTCFTGHIHNHKLGRPLQLGQYCLGSALGPVDALTVGGLLGPCSEQLRPQLLQQRRPRPMGVLWNPPEQSLCGPLLTHSRQGEYDSHRNECRRSQTAGPPASRGSAASQRTLID